MNMTTKRLLKRTMALTMVLMLLLMTLISCGGGGASSGLSMQNDVVRFPEYELEQELNEDGTPKVDAEGNPVYKVKLDANGAPIQKTDAEGKLVWKNKLDQEELTQLAKMLVGAYSKDYNTLILLVSAANGYAVTDADCQYEIEVDEAGNPKLDDNGDPILKYEVDEAGNQKLDENGKPIPIVKKDENGKVVRQEISDAGTWISASTEEGKASRLQFVKSLLREANLKEGNKNTVPNNVINRLELMNESDVLSIVNCFQVTVNTQNKAGFFDTLLIGIGKIVGWLTNTVCFGSYLAGICVFAIIVEIVMIPFAIKQQKNSIRQAKLRPKEMAIRNKYKGRTDQVTMQKMNQEISEFYQREHFSPASGCLPLLIQLPIIIALYNIVINPLHYVMGQSNQVISALNTFASAPTTAGGLGMALAGRSSSISLLSKFNEMNLDGLKDFALFSNGDAVYQQLGSIADSLPRFTVFGIDFGAIPSFKGELVLLLVPVLTFVTYFATSKLNRKFMYQPATNAGADAQQVACSNKMMDITMPAMSTFFTFMVPGLVGIYWIFRSLIGLLKQYIISRLMPLPKFTEEDYKAAEREMKGKQQQNVSRAADSGQVRAVRSLHYIDDEDFEDTRERGLARRAAIEEKQRAEQAKKAARSPFGQNAMKEDRKKNQKNKKDDGKTTSESNDTEN